MIKIKNLKLFKKLRFRILNLFRISNFGFRILALLLVTGYSLLVTLSTANAALVLCGTQKSCDAQGKCVITNPCTVCDLFKLISNVVNFLTEFVAMPLAVIVFIYGGFKILTSGVSEQKITEGKTALTQAIWGLFIVFAAWLIIDTIIKWFAVGGNLPLGPWNAIPTGC